MDGNFKCVEDQNFARCRYPICYRTIICHALFAIYKNKQPAQEYFNQLIEAFKNKSPQPYINKDFLSLYSVIMESDETGYLLVDHTRGCYPLVFYTDSNSDDFQNNPSASRVSAFSNVLEDFEKGIDKIIAEFSTPSAWNNALQKNLHEHYFPCKSSV